jgi:hypothetical protein
MYRRALLRSLPATGIAGFAGCLGDGGEESDGDEQPGRGTLRIENRSSGSVRAAYGLLDADASLADATLDVVQLTVEGDSFDVVYPDVTGGPYRFVVTLPERESESVDQQWDLDQCREFGVTARILPDALNMSETTCVRA